MPWLRTGDSAATHPRYLALYELPDVDPVTRIAAFGFVSLCATLSAAHLQDYLVSFGVAASVGHGAEGILLEVCVRAGLMEEVEHNGIRQWRIVDDPEFLHMRTREEIEWERQRKTDNANPALIVPIRLRDGDACRYCGHVVNWAARTGGARGTYDHRAPGQAGTVETMVVSCQACNASRKNDPKADTRHPLLPEPSHPYYSPNTREWIANHEWARANGYTITSRRGRTVPVGTIPDDRKAVVEQHRAAANQPAPTPARTDPQSGPAATARTDTSGPAAPTTARTGPQPGPAAPPATRQPAGHRAHPQRPDTQPDTAHHPRPAPTPRPLDTAEPAGGDSSSSGNAGSGRDGSGRVGSQAPQGPDRTRRTRGRRRSGRGRSSRDDH